MAGHPLGTVDVPDPLEIHPTFKGHSVIGTDTDLSGTYDFILLFYSNYGPISYRFSRQMAISDKNQFSYPCVFNTPAERAPLGIL